MSGGGSWGKLQYESWDHEKVEELGNRAWGVFLRAVAWSGAKRKDGFISASAMRKIEADQRVWDRLEEKHMLERRTSEGAWLHDWSEHNETNARRLEREESYSRRGKAGAATRWGDGNSHARTEAGSEKTDERSRSREDKRREDQDLGEPEQASLFDDPLGLAPPGEDPDAPVAPGKPSKTDTPFETLSVSEQRVVHAIAQAPELAPITKNPHALAQKLVALAPGVDVPREVTSSSAWLLANPSRRKSNGAAFLVKWMLRAQETASRRPSGIAPPPRPTAPERPRPRPYDPNAKYMGGAFDHIQEVRKAAEEAARKKAEEH